MSKIGKMVRSHTNTLRQLFATLLAKGPLSLPNLAHASGVSAKTLSRAAPDLEREGWLERREGKTWAVGPAGRVLAVAVSRERVRCAHVDAHGELLAKASQTAMIAPPHGTAMTPNELSRLVSGLARKCVTEAGLDPPGAVSIAWPGPISRQAGGPRRFEPSAPEWRGVRLRDLVDRAVDKAGLAGLPVELVNDADAEVLAEARWGVAADARVVLGIKISGGIGSAIIIDGVIHEGADGSVGEIGHLPVDTSGIDEDRPGAVVPLDRLKFCSCGFHERGHLERFASGRASIDRLVSRQKLRKGYDEAAPTIFDERNTLYRHFVLSSAGKLVGRALAGPWLLLEPDAVVVCPFPYDGAVAVGVKFELEQVIGRDTEVRLATAPDDDGEFWMTARGAAAYAFDRRLRPKLEERTARMPAR